MTWTGHKFDGSELSRTARGKMDDKRIAAWAAEQTERFRIVATHKKRALIAEELDQYTVNQMSDAVRPIAGMMLRLTDKERAEIVAAFDSAGRLKYPFKVK